MTGRARRIAGWPATANRLRFDGLVLDKRRFDNVIRAAGRPQAAVSRHLVARQRGAQPPKQQRRENLMELVAGHRVN